MSRDNTAAKGDCAAAVGFGSSLVKNLVFTLAGDLSGLQ